MEIGVGVVCAGGPCVCKLFHASVQKFRSMILEGLQIDCQSYVGVYL